MSLDTTLGGSPAGLRRVADWLRSDFGPAADTMATAVYRQRSRLAARGDLAGDELQGRAATLASSADRIALSAGETARSLDALAVALERAQAGLDDVRDEARAAGLRVDGHQVHDPAVGGHPRLVEAWHTAVRAADGYVACWSSALADAARSWGEHDVDLAGIVADLAGAPDETPAPS